MTSPCTAPTSPVPPVGTVFFPLDEQLALSCVSLSPCVHQALVRLASSLPFREASEHLHALLGVQVSASTSQRQTGVMGCASLQVQEAQALPLAACPEEQAGTQMAMSADGAFVPLVAGEWAEVKLLVIGHVEPKKTPHGEQAHTHQLSYFARLAEVTSFSTSASSEIRRRGIERAREVCAVQDGAEWLVGLTRSHRHDAVQILDFAHAAQRITAIAEVLETTGTLLPVGWRDSMLHRLKHEGPEQVVGELEQLHEDTGKHESIGEHVRYLRKRVPLMEYPTFQQKGWPIGSGMVESGNKVVMQARLKGPGMHWKRENVNPMLALRMAVCNHRWEEGWAAGVKQSRRTRAQSRWKRQQAHFLQRQQARQVLVTATPAVPSRSPLPADEQPKTPTGRTASQYHWGRQTFSPRILRQGGFAKK